jgi:hypothetical protein
MVRGIQTVVTQGSSVVCQNVDISVEYFSKSDPFHDEHMKTAPRLSELEIRDMRLMWLAIAKEYKKFKDQEFEAKHNLRRAERRLKWFAELAAFRKQEEADKIPLAKRVVLTNGEGPCSCNPKCHLMFPIHPSEIPNDICGIRRETLNDSEPQKLPCGHSYHGMCIAPWLAEHDNCPTCRGTWSVIEMPSFNDPSYHQSKRIPHPGSLHLYPLRQTGGFVEFSRRTQENYSINEDVPFDAYPADD